MTVFQKYEKQVTWLYRGAISIMGLICTHHVMQVETKVDLNYEYTIKNQEQTKNIIERLQKVETRQDLMLNSDNTTHAQMSARMEKINEDLSTKLEDLQFYKSFKNLH